MAANMQQMAGAGQMASQQQLRRTQTPLQLQQMVYNNLVASSQTPNTMAWQAGVNFNDRLGKTMDLISNLALTVVNGGIDHRVADSGCNFEREVFQKSPSKEVYDQTMASKTLEFFKKRQENEPNIQNTLNANAHAQAAQAAQVQAAQAQAMMSMQAQMGRGMGPSQQAFSHIQNQLQGAQQAQQAHQPPLQQQQMNMAMNMVNQAGRGAGAGPMPSTQQAMGMQNRQAQQVTHEMSRLAPADRAKVMELAAKMMAQMTEQQKAATRMNLQQRLTPQQLADFQAQGRDVLTWFYQGQAFQLLKTNMNNRIQQQQQQQLQLQKQQQQQQKQVGMPNQNAGQVASAVMMQQQHSQQSFQQRQNMMNANQPTDFSSFTPNMENMQEQQMNGLMAQQAGQMIVPASSAGVQHTTPQLGNQMMAGVQGQNQTPRQGQQQTQQQQQGTATMPQMNMNQAVQKNQNQVQLKMQQQQQQQQQQNQPNGVTAAQSPGINTLNTPVPRAPGGMNPMGAAGMGQGPVPFGDQRFNQGTLRPNNQAFNSMLANMTPEQRSSIQGLPPDKLNEIFQRWQSQRQEQMLNGGQMSQHQNRQQQSQFGGQLNLNLGGAAAAAAAAQGMQPQPGGMMPVNQQQQMQQMQQTQQQQQQQQMQQMQMSRMPMQNNHAQALIDSIEFPAEVQNLVGQLPPDVKTWRDLKLWLSQNGALSNNARAPLSALQHRQFQAILQKRAVNQQNPGQNLNANAGVMLNAGAQLSIQQQQQMALHRQLGSIPVPANVLHVTPQDIINVRSQRPDWASLSEPQLRANVLQMKKNTWLAQQQAHQQAQMRAQAMQGHPPGQPQTPGQQQMGVQTPIQMQQQTPQQPNNRTPTSQSHASPTNMAQTASMQSLSAGQRPQQGQANNAATQPRANNNNNNNNQQQQPVKSLKRPNSDDAADTSATSSAAPSAPRPASQSNQQVSKGAPTSMPQQPAGLVSDRRAYEQLLKQQAAGQSSQGQGNTVQQQPISDSQNRLRTIGQEEQRRFLQDSMPEVPMSPQERSETGAKLQRIALDVIKVSRFLTKWYSITGDDTLAQMFFRIRLRVLKQFADGESMTKLNDNFSITSTEIDQSRGVLRSIVASCMPQTSKGVVMKPGQQAGQETQPNQNQNPQPASSQHQQPQTLQHNSQGQPAPLNAANLEKNSQALKNQQKPSGRGAQAPPAPTSAQPPFAFGAMSPHGNPSYIGKPKDINLQLPPARKKPKLSGQQPGQTTTPSPIIAKTASPEVQRHEPPKPAFLCKEPDCDSAVFGFASEQALRSHVEEDHSKPKEDPLKFVKENLALALGLEPDGTPAKSAKPTTTTAAAAAADGTMMMMSTSASKQGQAPKKAAATPAPHDAAMKRTGSALSKGVEVNAKQTDAVEAKPAKTSPWTACTIDPQALLNHLGCEKGLPNIVSDVTLYRSLTPNDTPESSKDSGASEPNSDISEGAALEIDVNWQSLDTDLLLNLDNTSLEGDWGGFDPDVLLNPNPGPPDWDDVETDFSKPFEFDIDDHCSFGY